MPGIQAPRKANTYEVRATMAAQPHRHANGHFGKRRDYGKLEDDAQFIDSSATEELPAAGKTLAERALKVLTSPLGIIATYYVTGFVIYGWIERWDWVTCSYFLAVTSTTVGYGEVVPATDTGKLWTCLFAVIGMALTFAQFASLRDSFLEALDVVGRRKRLCAAIASRLPGHGCWGALQGALVEASLDHQAKRA